MQRWWPSCRLRLKSPVWGGGAGVLVPGPHIRGCCLCSPDRPQPVTAPKFLGGGSKKLEDVAMPISGAQAGG